MVFNFYKYSQKNQLEKFNSCQSIKLPKEELYNSLDIVRKLKGKLKKVNFDVETTYSKYNENEFIEYKARLNCTYENGHTIEDIGFESQNGKLLLTLYGAEL